MNGKIIFLRSPRTALLTIAAALLSGIVVSAALAKPINHKVQNTSLARTCADFAVGPNERRDTTFDPDKGIVTVTWYQGDKTYQTYLPFDPTTNFAGCSKTGRDLLAEVKEVYDSQVRDLCASFRNVVNGKEPLQKKNGVYNGLENLDRYNR